MVVGAGASPEALLIASMVRGMFAMASTLKLIAPTSSANAFTKETPRAVVDNSSRRESNDRMNSDELKGHPCVTPAVMFILGASGGAVTIAASL